MTKQQAKLSDWLGPKKRGKDDEAIERDRSQAVEKAKLRRRPITKKAPTMKKSKAVPQKAAPKKPKRKTKDADSESSDLEGEADDGSLEDFVVDDEEEEDEEGSSEDELESVLVPPPRRSSNNNKASTKINKRKKTMMELDSTGSSSSSDEEGGTFFQSRKARPSKPSQALQRASVAAKTRPNAALKVPSTSTAMAIKNRFQPVAKKNAKSTTTPDDDDDDSEVLSSPQTSTMKEMDDDDDDDDMNDSPPPKRSKCFAKAKAAPSKMSLDNEDSDSDDDDLTPIKPRSRNKRVIVNSDDDSSPEFLKKTLSDSSSDDAAVLDSLGKVNAHAGRHKRSLSDSSIESLGNGKSKTARRKQISKKSKKPSKKRVVYELSDSHDDDDHLQQAIRQSLSSDNDHVITNEGSSDDDDASRLAMRLAMKQSKKEAKKKANQKSVEPGLDAFDAGEEQPETLLLDETSDEEEDNGEDYDEGKKAATSVLETAEQLSAQVLGAMTNWTSANGNDSSKGPAATQGMIVDGALSLSAIEMSSNSKSQVWISQDVMQQIIPNVKLSNYQLVGVNWLALLHGMKCNIEGNRDTNVNGVLADEMGLVRTYLTFGKFDVAVKDWRENANDLVPPYK
jgi:hypothetical protein